MPKTIHTTLFGETLDCSKWVRIDNCVCQLFVIKHEDNAFIQRIAQDIDQPALYILLNREKRKAYIGQTDSFKKRLSSHLSKPFWTEALCFQANDNSIHITSVRYLEAVAYEMAKEVGNYDLSENTQVPAKPNIPAQNRYSVEEFFEYVRFLTQFIGCDIFTKSKKDHAVSKTEQAGQEKHIFFCTRAGSNAKGYYVEDTEEFVVFAGSELRSGECDSLTPKSVEKRQAFIDANCSQSKGKIILKADYTFTSPSAAAGMVVGGSSNGWTRWKDAEGRTLNEVFRANSTHKRTKTKIANTTQITGDNDLSEKLKGRSIKLSINGKGPYSKCEFGYRVVEEYLLENPTTTFKELQQLFPHDLVGSWSSWPLLQPDLEFAQRTKEEGRMRYFEGIGGGVFTTSDGIKFMVSNQWDWKNLPALLRVVEEQGMTYEIWK